MIQIERCTIAGNHAKTSDHKSLMLHIVAILATWPTLARNKVSISKNAKKKIAQNSNSLVFKYVTLHMSAITMTTMSSNTYNRHISLTQSACRIATQCP